VLDNKTKHTKSRWAVESLERQAVLGTRFKQESVIYVGKKAAYFYALMGFMVLVRDGKVTLRARGRRISTAVSAAIILCRLMANGVTIDKIIIGEDRLKKWSFQVSIKRGPNACLW